MEMPMSILGSQTRTQTLDKVSRIDFTLPQATGMAKRSEFRFNDVPDSGSYMVSFTRQLLRLDRSMVALLWQNGPLARTCLSSATNQLS